MMLFQIIQNEFCFTGRIHQTIDPVIRFLKEKSAHSNLPRRLLPEASRFSTGELVTLGTMIEQAFGDLVLEDNLIVECVDANFGFWQLCRTFRAKC
jgi:hypothetical protein